MKEHVLDLGQILKNCMQASASSPRTVGGSPLSVPRAVSQSVTIVKILVS